MRRSVVAAGSVAALSLGAAAVVVAPLMTAHAAPPASPVCQSGTTTVTVDSATVAVSAPVAISAATVPVVMTNIATPTGTAARWNSNAVSITRTGFLIRVASFGAPSSVTLTVQWLACATVPVPTSPPATTRPPTVPPTTAPPTTLPTPPPPPPEDDDPPPPPIG